MAAGRLAPTGGVALLDPCMGEGAALLQLQDALSRKFPCRAWGVELEESRSEKCRALEGVRFVGPADFLFVRCSPLLSFGCVWLNPPFDDEVGGGQRVESTFLDRATQLLMPGGVLCLVCPERVLRYNLVGQLLSWYEALSWAPFPDGCRKFGEVLCMGYRRPRVAAGDDLNWRLSVKEGELHDVYRVPGSAGPTRFEKGGLTELEMLRAMAGSKLRAVFESRPPVEAPSPPLELTKGHLALVLAGGFLNTSLQKLGEPPILIKATPFKECYLKEQKEEVRHEGTDAEETVTIKVFSEHIRLRIRVATQEGDIHDVQ